MARQIESLGEVKMAGLLRRNYNSLFDSFIQLNLPPENRLQQFETAKMRVLRVLEKAQKITTPRGKGGEVLEWQKAQKLLLNLNNKGKLPDSIRSAAKMIGKTNSTTRKAVHESDMLKIHFGIQDKSARDKKTVGSSVLAELAEQADAPTRDWIDSLTLDDRKNTEQHLQNMPPENRLELIKVLAVSPDSGRSGDVPLLGNELSPPQ